ncbi:ATPase involved in DNA repair-like protein [Desulfovibrio sp. TomC]|uniref:ATPase involved in DNA repair-like protein n=1 Tax=Desulfovibrio sp. TomC TaxID=1562888 RepID=UPI000573F949|nr:ATPase involved in DNA repair-like protein [Desulfovibrio sp. TomC]KHK03138.1 hypothetical protein NY78_1202 [Desulfovibrio sp. TomC]
MPADFFEAAGGQTSQASPDLAALVEERQDLTRRLDRLSGQASAKAEAFIESRRQLLAAEAFLDLAPRAAARLEDLTRELFGEVLDEIETDLTHAVREILGQNRTVVTRREVKNGKLFIEFEMEQDGRTEDIYVGQGGSVCNILSVGLRLVALSQLDPDRHRPFLVLDEQDCWLRPDLVPGFVRLIAAIADRLGIQVLYISHHPVDLFALEARRVFGLRPGRENGPTLTILADRTAGAAGAAELAAPYAEGRTAPGGE